MIVIIDFGSQYTQLIARRIREQGVYCEIHSCVASLSKIKVLKPEGIILSGGPNSVWDKDSPSIEPEIFSWNIPVLGICYGLHLMAALLGGKVEAGQRSEYGRTIVNIKEKDNDLFRDIPLNENLTVWMSHGDLVSRIPDGFKILAESQNTPCAAIFNHKKKFYGIQFHPEVTHTNHGIQILKNFVFKICGCRPDWTIKSFLNNKIEEIKKQVGHEKVLCALSGGVDSSVTAVLLQKAIGDRLTCIFVDNGLLRKGEADKVVEIFKSRYKINLIHVKADQLFMEKLSGVTDPEQKRKIIGHEFISLFEKEAGKLKDTRFLAQGTLYPDVIESESFKGPSAVIKSHHNVGGLPKNMKMSLVEPLRELFKDEVRELGAILNLDEEIIHRHPFPGPGLAIRIPGEVTGEKIRILQEADWIVREEIKKAGLYREIWQAFAVLLPVKSVGVMGDARTYSWTVVVRCVNSVDAMTADWTHLPYEVLSEISNRLINEIPEVNRTLYDITSKPPGTIEWE